MTKKKSVLILDDDDMLRVTFATFLKDCDFDTIGSSTGEKALELIKKHPVDAAIVDLRLPGIDGIEFIKRAREMYPNMVSIIVTGFQNLSLFDDVKSLPKTSRKILFKPIIDLDVLSTEINRQLSENQHPHQ